MDILILVTFVLNSLVGNVFVQAGSDEIVWLAIPGVDPCQSSDAAGLYAHPDECQLFYNCSMGPADVISGTQLGPYVDECTYPQVFDSYTKKCTDYHDVDCGSRKVVLNGCDYKRQLLQCNNAVVSCRPCVEVDYPPCEGLPDGQNPILAMLNSPYFAVCDSGRFIERGTCGVGQNGKTMTFHPVNRVCV